MNDVIARMRAGARHVAHTMRSGLRQPVTAVTTAPARHADARARAICPVDDWAFTPLYTDGACPLCGWEPPGYVLRPPLMYRLEWYWVGMLGIVVVSAVMLIAVLKAYAG